jgi:hypothetical protein
MSTLRVNNITDASGGSSSLSVPGAAKAWVNFNGKGTVAIRAQFNVSSITDNGTGTYTVNFSTAFQNTSYCMTNTASEEDSRENIVTILSVTTSSAQIRTRGGGGSIRDSAILNAIVIN